jgi:hypothetical protein
MSTNIFDNLEEVNDVLHSINIIRKSKKKLREIEHLKQKPTRTPEEEIKISEEPYWRSFLPPKKKLLTKNAYGIVGKVVPTLQTTDDCPICMCEIPKEYTIRTNCSHTYCGTCIEQMVRTIDKHLPLRCAICRTHTTTFDFQSEDVMIDILNAMALNHSKYVPTKTSEPEDYIELPTIEDAPYVSLPAVTDRLRWLSSFSGRTIYDRETHYGRVNIDMHTVREHIHFRYARREYIRRLLRQRRSSLNVIDP